MWRWRESNPRPNALFYKNSTCFSIFVRGFLPQNVLFKCVAITPGDWLGSQPFHHSVAVFIVGDTENRRLCDYWMIGLITTPRLTRLPCSLWWRKKLCSCHLNCLMSLHPSLHVLITFIRCLIQTSPFAEIKSSPLTSLILLKCLLTLHRICLYPS